MPTVTTLSARPGRPRFALQPDRACIGTDTNLFFSDDPTVKEAAKAICRRCPYQADCEAWAVEHHERGIWGGTDDGDRSRRGGRRKAKTRTVVCAWCDTEFTTNQPCVKYCSAACGERGRKRARQEKKETRQPEPGPVEAETNVSGTADYDAVVVERLVTGQMSFGKAAEPERLEAIRQLAARGLPANTIRQILRTSGATTRQLLTQAATRQQADEVKAA